MPPKQMQEKQAPAMSSAEFDKFAQEYGELHDANIAITGESGDYFAEYKMRDLRRLVGDAPSNGEFLDFGAGIGNCVPYFRKHLPGAALTCVDVSAKSLAVAATRFPGQARFIQFDGSVLPFESASFDAGYAACVFHHIPREAHVALLQEIRRVLRPGGLFMVYEHNPLNPLTRRAVDQCPFDENAVLMPASALRDALQAAGFASPRIRFRLFFPKLLALLRPLEEHLSWCPLGAQYLVWARA